MSATLGQALNRTWGGPGDTGTAGSGDERDEMLLRRLVRPRESGRIEELDEKGRTRKKAGTMQEQQRREEAQRLARRERHREEARLKDEEREVLRAQVYAINKLMRAREEAAFAEFKAKRDADGEGPLPPDELPTGETEGAPPHSPKASSSGAARPGGPSRRTESALPTPPPPATFASSSELIGGASLSPRGSGRRVPPASPAARPAKQRSSPSKPAAWDPSGSPYAAKARALLSEAVSAPRVPPLHASPPAAQSHAAGRSLTMVAPTVADAAAAAF